MGEGAIDMSIAFGKDEASVGGNDPCVSTAEFVAAVGDEHNGVVGEYVTNLGLVVEVDDPLN